LKQGFVWNILSSATMEHEERSMRSLIVTAIVAIGALAFAGGALALESGFTCDAEDTAVPQTALDGATPAAPPTQAPTSSYPRPIWVGFLIF
jgi:hypothetical protein